MKQMFILVQVEGLCVQNAIPFDNFDDAKQAFFDWTGVPYETYLERLQNGTHDHAVDWDQTKIF